VADTGPGIPDQVRPRIFEPFFTTKEIGQGTGLGLSVSHGIIQAHGGLIECERAPGGGVVFTVVLPVGGNEAPTGPSRVEEREDEDNGRILIIDDAADIAELLGEILSGLGRRIETAANGREALGKLEHQEFDLIVCDIRMPDLDGPGLYAEINARRPELLERMIFVTGDTLSESVKQFLESTRMPVVEKPFVPDEIRTLAAKMLSQNSRSASN
jgi:two-component system NtrC family sensor kinase